jgi:hypothetical protein
VEASFLPSTLIAFKNYFRFEDSYRIASMKTLRFLLINRAARLARISGRTVLGFSSNSATEILYDRVVDHLAA